MLIEERLEKALLWMFENGIPHYFSGMPSGSIKTEINANIPGLVWGCNIYRVERQQFNYVLKFDISNWGDTNRPDFYKANKKKPPFLERWDATRFVVDIQDTVVEYWVVNQIYDNGIGIGCLFIITVADSLTSSRNIVLRDTQYIRSAVVSGRVIEFPEDNLYMLHLLNAKRWPFNFQNTDIDDYEILFDEDNIAYKQKIDAEKRRYFDWSYGIYSETGDPPKGLHSGFQKIYWRIIGKKRGWW